MSLPHCVGDRVRPWYFPDLFTFLFGVVSPPGVRPGAILQDGSASRNLPVVITAVVSGPFDVLVLRFTLGNAWGYAAKYLNTGGAWTDAPLVAPVTTGVVAAAVVYAATMALGAAARTGLWSFAFAVGVAAIAVSFAAGYRETSP